MKLFKKLLWFLIISSPVALTAAENEGKAGLAFLKVGVDARASGMGEAYTAASNNAFATYWNPAGLMGASRSNVVFMHNEWLFDVNGEFGALQFRSNQSSLAFHVYSFNVGDIEVRSIPSDMPLETTGANYLSAGVSYARSLSQNLDAGLTVKYLYEKIFFESAGGFAADLGLLYRGLLPNLTLGGTIQNLGKMGEFKDEATTLPKIARLGAQYAFPQALGPAKLLLAADLVKPFDENLRGHFGAEAGLWKQLMLRFGYMAGYESRSFSAGLGIRKSFIQLDYSYSPFQDDLGDGHRFSLYLAL